MFAGSEHAAFTLTLIQSAKPNDVDPQAWLVGILRSIADTPQTRLSDLLLWKRRNCAPVKDGLSATSKSGYDRPHKQIAERALRGIALGRISWLLEGSER